MFSFMPVCPKKQMFDKEKTRKKKAYWQWPYISQKETE